MKLWRRLLGARRGGIGLGWVSGLIRVLGFLVSLYGGLEVSLFTHGQREWDQWSVWAKIFDLY